MPIKTITKMKTINMLTFSSSKPKANKTNSEKYPKKYCSVMLFWLMILMDCDGVLLWLNDIFAPTIPSVIATSIKTKAVVFRMLKVRLLKMMSITSLISTKKYNGTKALK